MVTRPLSIRFEPALLDRLRHGAAARDTTPSGLAQRLIDEGLRMEQFPGVVFHDGPSGRRASLASGPDVWEVAAALRACERRGEAAIGITARELDLTEGQVGLALAYAAAFTDEIDAEIAANDRAAADARRTWEAQQRFLA